MLMLMLIADSKASFAQSSVPIEYAIGTGDVIVIDVYNEKDLFVRTMVNAKGIVKIPMIGGIQVLGRTPTELEQTIEAALFDGYLVNPDVSVMVEKYRPFYIKGAVNSPGAYEFRLNLTLEQAIAIGGGLRDRASKSDWIILRGTTQTKMNASKDTLVYPGDVIQIDESIF
ncbi:hypothetical protein GLIP_3179 [Aliiglaciecola lipolytica E3]|uniref:Uncharacterized protein n=2 Tax=Aliiglaciecola TaxID=1406885 RepID=K6XVZ7_9ALTE|nr:hypothetical protein GLIP_3179 [Aliiglaciecola lipolytica E3]